MKHPIVLFSLLIGSLFSNMSAHAEGRCPAGYYPVDTPGVLGCAPIPGYWDNQQQQPAPPPPRWSDRYGAIATDLRHGALGAAINAPDRQTAEQRAMADCQAKGGIDCELETWYRNRCAVLVLGDEGHITVNRTTLEEATQQAMKICRRDTTNCEVYYSACSLPVRIQ